MRQPQRLTGMLLGGAVMALSQVSPVWAAATSVTAVRLNPTQNGLTVTLETNAVEEKELDSLQSPQVITTNRGNDLMADVYNVQLQLSQGGTFRQDNPMPGIKSVVVNPLDGKSIRIIVKGVNNAPQGKIIQRANKGITLSFSPTEANQAKLQSDRPSAATVTPSTGDTGTSAITTQTFSQAQTPASIPTTTFSQAQTPVSIPTTTFSQTQTPETQTPASIPTTTFSQAQPPTTTPAPTPPPQVAPPQLPQPDVLVPNPQITIDGNPAPVGGALQPVAPVPPLLPRAIAPPVGDIGISNIDSSSTAIDLGTQTRVPRLVLREAPVREVLALLARSSGLNLAFTGAAATTTPGAPTAPGAATTGGPTISLDIENESVQDVFNNVLRLSGLQANRQGNTIFVGSNLPQAASNLITRSFRLNQVGVSAAAGFLSAQGAESQQVVTQTTRTTTGEGADRRTTEQSTTTIVPLAATAGTGPLLLRGLSVLTDSRLNALTMVGNPRQIEIASSFLTQLDARKRQVAVNVKIVDINLLGTDDFGASFSFGVGRTFFTIDQGAAVVNYGGINPPSAATSQANVIAPGVIQNPFAGANIFLDPNNTLSVPNTVPGTTTVNASSSTNSGVIPGILGTGTFLRPTINLDNPLTPGISTVTLATNNIVTNTTAGNPPVTTTTVTPGTNGTITATLPQLFQYPTRFLSLLRAQITSGNAKILTDPTLVIQEGQTASVKLTQEVITNITVQRTPTTSGFDERRTFEKRDTGLILQVAVDRIDDNGFVTLTVNPSVSAPVSSQRTSTGDTLTLVAERTISSGQIRLRDGQTLILSGIIQDAERTTVSKVPILGDIPILGALFRSTNRVNQRQEVIVLLTPQVMDDSSRSAFGYNYTPGTDVRQLLQQRGFPVQGGNR